MNVTDSTSNGTTSNPGNLGWTSTPNTRGSIDIIYSCFATLFLCSWTVLHLNIPSCSDSSKTIFFRKLKWMIIALVVPEFVTAIAFVQWMRAWTLKLRLKTQSWTQAWFYVSGGLRYSEFAPADPDVPGSVDGRYEPRVLLFYDDNGRLLWVPEALMLADLPSEDKIKAENKADSLAKLIVVLQVAWFTTQCISRGASKLPISQLEIGTIAYVGCTMLTTALWWHKPLDIRLWKALDDAEVSAADGLRPDIIFDYNSTTSMYLGDYRLPNFLLFSQLMMRYQKIETGPREGESEWVEFDPMRKFGHNRFESTCIMEVICGAILASLLGTVHIAAWNLEFPSKKDQTMWRVAALFVTLYPIFLLIFGYIIIKVDLMIPIKWLGKAPDNLTELPWWNRGLAYMKLRLYRILLLDKLVAAWGTSSDRSSFIISVLPVLFLLLYIPGRIVLVELMFMCFTSMPAGVYDTVQWVENLLHI